MASRCRWGVLGAALGLLAIPLPAVESPWVLLEGLRAALESAGPLTARFVQTYTPAGFSSSDEEGGHLSIWLPRCLRWNYDEGKSFLVCGGEVHQWNEDEPGGRVYEIDPTRETGLDLLLVDVDTLRERYVASSQELPDGSKVIDLAVPPEQGEFRARIFLNPEGTRVSALEYVDSEGNRTRFALEGYQRLEHTALFNPPAGVEWTRE